MLAASLAAANLWVHAARGEEATVTAAAEVTVSRDVKSDGSVPSGEVSPAEARPTSEVIAYIDSQIRAAWTDAGIKPSPRATDSEWCRRVYLDLVGRIPSVEELATYLADKSSDREARLVERLINSDEYAEDFASHWTTIWTNLLIGRSGGTDRRDLTDREGLKQYLRRSFYTNKPYDRLVYELVTADGVNKPGEENYNGAVNYLVDKLDDNGVQATAHSARLFLGVQVQCTQCHNHPFNSWKQDQFWGLNAFFRQTRPLRTFEGRDVVSVWLTDEDFPGENRDPEDAVTFYENRDGTAAAVRPVFLDGTEVSSVGFVDETNRRRELAELMMRSPEMPAALVNRMWAHFFGYGFTKPVDDMGPHNPPSHPELLDELATQVVAHGYDLRALLTWIVLSESYALSSRLGDGNAEDDPTIGNTPLFSRFYLRQMTAEQLYESLLVATQADRTDYRERERLRQQWLEQFTVAFGTDEGDETTTFNGTIPQALMMMNGELVGRATQCQPGSFLHDVATSSENEGGKIARLYQAALARQPSKAELNAARAIYTARGGNTAAMLQDVWWAILNSNEFILNH